MTDQGEDKEHNKEDEGTGEGVEETRETVEQEESDGGHHESVTVNEFLTECCWQGTSTENFHGRPEREREREKERKREGERGEREES